MDSVGTRKARYVTVKPMAAKKLISYIFPIYNEEATIPTLFNEVAGALEPLTERYDFELIFINDGSRDESLRILLEVQAENSSVTVIDLARNFGHQMAVTAGLDFAVGDAAIIMDSDLQDPPAVSLKLIEQWEAGFDVVYAQRRQRQDSFFKRSTAHLFYRLLSRLSEVKIPEDTGDFRLIDRKVVDELKKYRERNRFLRGLVSYVGFRQTAVLFDRDPRFAGVTGYPLAKMLKFAADGLTGFSTVPLRLIMYLGFAVSGISFIGIIYALGIRLLVPEIAVPGWAFTSIAIFFIGGIQLLTTGVIGLYVGRIYTEVQQRPLYSINRLYGPDRAHTKQPGER
jgi:dolichol-phosphate mannosyltransferase